MSNKKDTKKDVTAKKAVTQKVSIDLSIDTKKVLSYNKFKNTLKNKGYSKQQIAIIYCLLYCGTCDYTDITCSLTKNAKSDTFKKLLISFYQLTGSNSKKNTAITKDCSKLHAGYITQIISYFRYNGTNKTWFIKTINTMQSKLDDNMFKQLIDICINNTKDILPLDKYNTDKLTKNLINNFNTDDIKNDYNTFILPIAKKIKVS